MFCSGGVIYADSLLSLIYLRMLAIELNQLFELGACPLCISKLRPQKMNMQWLRTKIWTKKFIVSGKPEYGGVSFTNHVIKMKEMCHVDNSKNINK